MAYRLQRRTFSAIVKTLGLLALSACFPLQSFASNFLSRPDLASARRSELINKLRAITGWDDLRFDEHGALHPGKAQPAGGSATARELLTAAMSGEKMIVIEDASNRADVVFCRVVEARWTKEDENKPPVFLILIDFADFSHVTGDRAALAAFNVGWGVLHEIDHVVHDSVDAAKAGEAGECEDSINRMRRECGLAERAEYFYTYLPGATSGDFMTRYVRIAFEQRVSDAKRKRYWLIWDAKLVGGLDEQKQIAARR